ncbi:MAG: hypothetical protein ACP5NZ_03005 [Nanobdellota archaeon]
MGRKKAIKLPSSENVYGHDDGSYVESTLIALLDEASNMGLKDNDRIITMCEYLPDDFPDDIDPTLADLKLKKEIMRYKDLKDTYKMSFGREYSPQTDEERRDFRMAVIEREAQRRGAWGWYVQTMAFTRAAEKEQKREEQLRGKDSIEKERLKKEWEKEDNNNIRTLYIA